MVRLLFYLAALLLVIAALVRTWASSYLQASVVYAADLKSETLVADGPYRRVRNPLYFANVLMVIAIGAMMSRLGFFVAVITMLVFSYRLILREEAELQASQGQSYAAYCKAVPRLLAFSSPARCAQRTASRMGGGNKGRILVLGFCGGAYRVRHNLKPQVIFCDPGRKPRFVLGILGGPSKEIDTVN